MHALLLFSGPIAVGKSVIAQQLIQTCGFKSIRSGPYLVRLAKQQGLIADRSTLQTLGDSLDEQTDYRWLIDQVAAPAIDAAPEVEHWLLDSVRKDCQVQHFRSRYLTTVYHVHLTATADILRQRFEGRRPQLGEYSDNTPYESATSHPNELSAWSLGSIADIVIDVGEMLPQEAAAVIQEEAFRRCGCAK